MLYHESYNSYSIWRQQQKKLKKLACIIIMNVERVTNLFIAVLLLHRRQGYTNMNTTLGKCTLCMIARLLLEW